MNTPHRTAIVFAVTAAVLVTNGISWGQSTLTWRYGTWGSGVWDHATSEWNPGPVAFTDGDYVRFMTDNSDATIAANVQPRSIYSSGNSPNRWTLTGSTGSIADFPGTATTMTVDGGLTRVNFTGPISFSGGTTVQAGGTLLVSGGHSNFGTGAITLDNGTLNADNNVTFTNDCFVTAGGGSVARNNTDVTYSGTWTLLGGSLLLSDDDWGSMVISGDTVLAADSEFRGGNTNTNTTWDTQVTGNGSGEYTLTVNVTGLGMQFGTNGGGQVWDIGGFRKTGSGDLRLYIEDILGDAVSVTGTKGGSIFSVQQGTVDLFASQTATELVLGASSYTALGTYGGPVSGADFEIADWSTYFSGTGVFTLVATVPEPASAVLLGLAAVVARRRRR